MQRSMNSMSIAAIVLSLAGMAGCPCACPPCETTPLARTGQDQIQLTAMTGTDSATIVLDGRRAAADGCDVNDEVLHAATAESRASLANLLTPGSCKSNLAVFARDNAMSFRQETGWRDTSGDLVSVSMAKREQLPLAIWMVIGDTGDGWRDVENAKDIYNGMQAGINFEPVSIEHGSSNDSDLQTSQCQQSTVDALKDKVGFTDNRLNVYYVEEIIEGNSFPSGIFCDKTTPQVILILLDNVAGTLGHEIGHALSLVHTNPPEVQGIPAGNLMLQLSNQLETLTLGQCFRVNLTPSSAINKAAKFGGSRTGQVVPECDPITQGAECPALTFDVVPR